MLRGSRKLGTNPEGMGLARGLHMIDQTGPTGPGNQGNEMDKHSQDNVQAGYRMACERARAQSIDDGCGYHVNAKCAVTNGLVYIASFEVSDWFVEGSTVATFSNGREL